MVGCSKRFFVMKPKKKKSLKRQEKVILLSLFIYGLAADAAALAALAAAARTLPAAIDAARLGE